MHTAVLRCKVQGVGPAEQEGATWPAPPVVCLACTAAAVGLPLLARLWASDPFRGP